VAGEGWQQQQTQWGNKSSRQIMSI